MRVYQILGTKTGVLDKVQILLIAGSLVAGIFLESLIVMFAAPMFMFLSTHLVKRYWFDGREEWPFMLGRMLSRPKGSWNQNEHDI